MGQKSLKITDVLNIPLPINFYFAAGEIPEACQKFPITLHLNFQLYKWLSGNENFAIFLKFITGCSLSTLTQNRRLPFSHSTCILIWIHY